MTVGGDHNRST
jgi:hypothetical protein